ncbi:hypothetical protein [uncultured Bdellovibrio sp.]|uniref:hypothetical protein n=1 Tax=Bdellovibrio sp. HCB-162 TaxID=3394234 RepID=UPI0025F4CE9E|nr:hypothetical protein [uncultured Bdellovibrio sp.]
MERTFSDKVTLPSWIFIASIFIHSLAPDPAQDFAWLLLMVVYVDTYFQAEGQGPLLKKITMTLSIILKLLWLVGLAFNWMR